MNSTSSSLNNRRLQKKTDQFIIKNTQTVGVKKALSSKVDLDEITVRHSFKPARDKRCP